MSSTIAAISTPQAVGGIGIIRISGPEAFNVADMVFRTVNGKKLADSKGYAAHYGHVCDGDDIIDEAVALVFRQPHSYTGENVVELSCHGGLYILKRALRAVINAGASSAQAGEFTKRAFLNNKLGLTQAEAVMDIISAQGEQAAKAALAAHEGALSKKINSVRDVLVSASANMAAWVDYPDEDIPELDFARLRNEFSNAHDELQKLLGKFDAGRAMREGIDTVIAGRPNVGKSTLMNLLSGSERSIVTSFAGTTRDVVEETVRLGNVILRLADTAGLRETADPIESIGVGKARERLERAGLILAVFDASEPLDDMDRKLLEEAKGRAFIAVVNKTDLKNMIDTEYIKNKVKEIVYISAETGEGYDSLAAAAERVVGTANIDPYAGILATERQRDCCKRADDCITEAVRAIDDGMTMDAINVSIDCAISALLELTGEKASEAVVDEVFSHFCVGK